MRILMSLLATLFLFGGYAFAEEAVDPCADEVGAAYGLCNAYCEGMDCDSEFPSASQNACDRVKTNYLLKTGDIYDKGEDITEYPMPCDEDVDNSCPLYTNIESLFDDENWTNPPTSVNNEIYAADGGRMMSLYSLDDCNGLLQRYVSITFNEATATYQGEIRTLLPLTTSVEYEVEIMELSEAQFNQCNTDFEGLGFPLDCISW